MYIYIYRHSVYVSYTWMRYIYIYDQLSDPRSTWDACRKSCRFGLPRIGDPFVSGCVGSTCLIYLVAGAITILKNMSSSMGRIIYHI